MSAKVVEPSLPDGQVCSCLGDKQPSGGVTGGPRRWLRLEALVLRSGSLIAFTTTGEPWWLIPAVLFLPDLLMAGYLRSTRPRGITYNLAHATPIPAAAIVIGRWQHTSAAHRR